MVENVAGTDQDWDDAIICVWKINARPYADVDALVEHISDLVEKINEARANDYRAIMADHRTVYFNKEDNTFRVASWFLNTTVPKVASAYDKINGWAGVCDKITPLNYTFGREFTERSTCVASCLNVADTVRGKLARQALLENLLKLYGQGPCGMGG